MKTITLLISLAMPLATTAQTADKVIDYAASKTGKRVGGGTCYDFVEAAIKSADRSFDGSLRNNIPMDSAQAGDIVKFSGCKFADGSRAPLHWGIVVSVEDSVITLYHQNAEGLSLKESRVIMSDISLVGMKSGKVVFYRRD